MRELPIHKIKHLLMLIEVSFSILYLANLLSNWTIVYRMSGCIGINEVISYVGTAYLAPLQAKTTYGQSNY